MVRITLFLILLLIRNNAYAWSCSFATTAEGWYLDGSMSCQGIATDIALQNHYCSWYRPNDPYCSIYQAPVCSPQVEYQSLSCPINQSGAINQSRTYECSAQTWTAWTTTSNNCTPNPPTCIESTETRQLTCQAGYEGYLQEQRSSICSDPYGSPIWTAWSTILDTCKMTSTNINNPASPISPISPISPNSVLSTTSDTTMTSDIGQVTQQPLLEPSVNLSTNLSTPSSTTASTNTTSSTQSSSSSNTTVQTTVPKGKDIVPGFGIVMSMQLINAGYNMQQQQIEESIKLIQEQDYERQQNILLEFISANDTGDYIIRASANRWRSILRDNPLQRFDRDD